MKEPVVLTSGDHSSNLSESVVKEMKPSKSAKAPQQNKENVSSPKVNAFQFMMNNRHKSIGRNSPGKELMEDDNEPTKKKDLKARKNLLESWAAEKGASKRKREYEEVGRCINIKLEKREKKLKKMLNIESQSDDEVVVQRRKKRAIIASDTEESNDSTEFKSEKKNTKRKSNLSEKKKSVINLSPNTVKSWKFKIKLCMDSNEDYIEETNDVQKEEIKDLKVTEDKIEIKELEEKINENETKETEEKINADETVNSNQIEVEEKLIKNGRILRSRTKPKKYDDFFSNSSDEDSSSKKKSVKVAPVFLKATPKPKIDPEVVEARRQFLLSGIPSSLKKEMKKQQCIEDKEYDVFPSISHIQQKSIENILWDLPEVDLNLKKENTYVFQNSKFSRDLLDFGTITTYDFENQEKIMNCRKIIKDLKGKYPNYPVYRIFNSLYKESGIQVKNLRKTLKRRSRSKIPEKETKNAFAMWTEKYKPKSSLDIIGNNSSVTTLKEWLQNFASNSKKADSEEEFCITDNDSCDSIKCYGNSVVLRGPTGSGKTAAVYAICNELGFNILEVNSSSKRTGKRLLQDLQEATQSHQVCKNNVLSFVKEKSVANPKMCVLLVEDVDLVFEQDEGFGAALSQIIMTSKRPVILTMTDSCMPKFVPSCTVISFSPLSSILTVWLQIVCLIEGLYLSLKSLVDLLNYNRGDIRRTLLQLQFYVTSGGQLKENKNHQEETIVLEDVKVNDDSSNLSDLRLDGAESSDVKINYDCLDTCHVTQVKYLPYCNNLEIVWWNWPNILNLANLPNLRLCPKKETDLQRFSNLADCYDALSLVDLFANKNHYHESLERRWCCQPKDSLTLDENLNCFENSNFGEDFSRIVLNSQIKLFRDFYEDSSCELDMAVPDSSHKKWCSKHFAAEDKLQEAVSPSEILVKKSVFMDYMPYLRNIARSEIERANSNRKRGNRFYSYLRNLGITEGSSSYKIACDVFTSGE